ncbi:DUF4240 domain-containing protein [Streptomyces longisporus]|uniref:DUF4240 domain-containing protein n=1 Tax=Streptomyces longisporus TaxID=1948 RepID=A0ABN3LG86_STRLO
MITPSETTSKDSDKPVDVAVVDHLAGLPMEEILAFEHRLSCLRDAVYRWDVWAAAYLLGRGCSDDRFSDFTAGLVALGREWYEWAVVCPDALAEHPAVRIAAADGDQDVIFDEDFNFVSSRAYARLTRDSDAIGEAWDVHTEAHATTEEDGEGMGESFDFGDAQQLRRRLRGWLRSISVLYPTDTRRGPQISNPPREGRRVGRWLVAPADGRSRAPGAADHQEFCAHHEHQGWSEGPWGPPSDGS